MTPIQPGQYFLGSTNCKGCHGFDTLHYANVDANGTDINLYDDWESSMMANAAKDPLWRAKVSHEILSNPNDSLTLQTTCTSCHSPMGHYTAIYHGATSYTISDLNQDTLGLNGVACGGCHEIGTEGLGSLFTGNIPYDTTKKEFGPFTDPLTGPMQLYVGLTPTYSEHMGQSRTCSPCHTLITNTVDLNGNLTGGTFIEQATYHEWLNSALAQDNVTCQHCHMPQVLDSVRIANNILSLAPRSPFNQHQFVGGNYFMVNLIKNNKAALNISAPDVDFDSTLTETKRMLEENALSVHLYLDSITTDTAYLRFRIMNKCGHKFPSGYPSRRAVVQFVTLNSNGDSLFQSGMFDGNYEVKNIDPVFEPHFNVINQSSESEIYEMIMGDVNDDLTTVLLRADTVLKDNRIPPEGFVTDFYDYDTIKIVGDAVNDPDFNKNGNSEGTGRDEIHYHVPISGAPSPLNVYARVFYQSVPPRWVENMFTLDSAPIDTFKNMFNAADRKPLMIAADSLLNIAVPTSVMNISSQNSLHLLHSLTNSSIILQNEKRLLIYDLVILDVNGKVVSEFQFNSMAEIFNVDLPKQSGIYFIKIKTNAGNFIFKAVKT